MSITLLVTIGLILFLCSSIQGAVGFAFNIFAIPLLVWSGLSLSEAIATTSLPVLFQSATSTYKLRASIIWKDVAFGSLLRYIGIPIGIYLLVIIDGFDKNSVKQIIGLVVFAVVMLQVFFKVTPKDNVHFIWTIIAFFTSGITLGMVSMGGPPVILWVMAHKWSALRIRSFLSSLFLLAAPLQVVLLYYHFGHDLLNFFITGLVFSPVVIAGTLVGVKIGNLLDAGILRKIVLALLIVTSLVSIISPYIKA